MAFGRKVARRIHVDGIEKCLGRNKKSSSYPLVAGTPGRQVHPC